jgi:arylsulfatase A-like enzyme
MHRGAHATAALGLFALASLAWSCQQAPEPSPTSPSRPEIRHVVLITIDALRAQALPIYGNKRIATPHLSELARQGIVFEQCLAPSPWTRPSVVSMLTGLPPAIHDAVKREIEIEAILPPTVPTLAESMRGAGYRTAAFGYNPFLACSPNVRRGFGEFCFYPTVVMKSDGSLAQLNNNTFRPTIDREGQRGLEDVINQVNSTAYLTELVRGWLGEHARQKFFLWLHYYDPHNPYMPPPGALQRVSAPGAPANEDAYGEWLQHLNRSIDVYLAAERELLRGKESEAAKAAVRELGPKLRSQGELLRALYEAEVIHVDDAVGLLVERLKALGIYENTLIIVSSDHGEEFWEHGGLEHGHAFYQEVVHIPLIVKPPHSRAGQRISDRVSLLSVFPTIAELCSIAPPAGGLPAPSLASRWEDPEVTLKPSHFVLGSIMYGEPATAVVFGDKKYIRHEKSEREELYDLRRDPGEKASLVGRDPAALERARRLLGNHAAWSRAMKRTLWSGEVPTTERSEQMRELLRSHRYLK